MKTASLTLIFTICAAMLCMPLDAGEPGRTDGPEGSEVGRGGYPFGGPEGRFYISPAFGSGIFDRNADDSRTGLLYSMNLGYERDGWLAIEGGYAYLSDRELSIYSLGSRFDYNADPLSTISRRRRDSTGQPKGKATSAWPLARASTLFSTTGFALG